MLICIVVLYTPMIIPIIFSNHIFAMLNLPEIVVQEATTYFRIVGPGVIIYHLGFCYSSFSTSAGRMSYTLWSIGIASVIHWITAYYLAVHLNMKMTGVSIASCL